MKNLGYIFVFTMLFFDVKAQHNAMYSQYMFNGLLINPAYAGSNEVLTATAVNRNQWVGFDGAPHTSTFSLHTPLKNKKVNLGCSFMNDRYGITQQNKINAVYAYRLFFKGSSLSFGLQGGFNFIRNNWSQISTTTTGDQVFTNQYSQQNLPETGFGLYYQQQEFYLGLSAPDLLTLKKVNGLIYKPVLITGGYLISVSEELKIKPSIVLKYIKKSPLEMDINANIYFKVFGLGVS